ncbi:hypothetical protein DPEC_G00308050 [Dallia pectoralis]|uniref:Uncharacterized protein n=1 Tax=Dallia pectoralis TaxID=75939 RepID=A0ACC2FEK4_DALPE|nr:hypothetical protein DPEC_G00308050 [Dallia pectoralis]
MRRFQSMRWLPFTWLRGESAQDETSPLLPKEDTDNELTKVVHQRPDNRTTEDPGPEQFNGPENRGGTGTVEPGASSGPFSLSDCLLRYLLIFSNLFFTMLGLVFLAVGFWGLIDKESFAQEKIGQIASDPMLVVVTLGLMLSTLCLSGCVGALRENRCLLRVFAAAVLVLVTAQVLVAIVAYTLEGQIEGYLRSGILIAMARYQDDLDLRFITDEIQIGLQCCGADSYRDWEINMYYNCSAPGVLSCGVPATCCVDPLENGTVWNSQCGVGAQRLDEFSAQSLIFLGGCLGGVSRWIDQHTGLIGAVGIVLFGVQIITLFIATRMLDNIQWSKATR